ncbi:hypothetical protein HPG69_014143, partial [Diceros bicornis minor]
YACLDQKELKDSRWRDSSFILESLTSAIQAPPIFFWLVKIKSAGALSFTQLSEGKEGKRESVRDINHSRSVTLNDGNFRSELVFDTFASDESKAGATAKMAIDVGFHHINVAYFYQNEEEI